MCKHMPGQVTLYVRYIPLIYNVYEFLSQCLHLKCFVNLKNSIHIVRIRIHDNKQKDSLPGVHNKIYLIIRYGFDY